MNRYCRLASISILVASAVALSGVPAYADANEKAAQVAFDEAMKLMSAKRYADACEKFAQSLELDPGMGTQFRLAECYEKLGRLASAYEQYNSVANAAAEAGKKDREAVSRKRADALEPRIARLTIVVGPNIASLPGLEVSRDGTVLSKELWGKPVYIDPGDHVVTIKASGRLPLESKVWAEGAARLVVNITSLERPPPVEVPPRSKIPAIAMAAGGGLGIVLGATFAGIRASKKGDAQELRDGILAGGGYCGTNRAPQFATDCDSLASATKSGDAFGTVSVVSFVVGAGALAGAGVYLLWPEPKPAERSGSVDVRWAPVVSPGLAGWTISGTF